MSLLSYTHQNLCSRSFSGEKLCGVSFQSAQCGISLYRRFLKAGVSFFMGILLGLFMFAIAMLNTIILKDIFFRAFATSTASITWMSGLSALLIVLYCVIIRLLFYKKVVLAITVAIVTATVATIVVLIAVAKMLVGLNVISLMAIIAIMGIIALTGVLTGAIVVVGVVTGITAGIGVIAGVIAGAVSGASVLIETAEKSLTVVVMATVIVYLTFSIMLFWEVIWEEVPQLSFIRHFALGFRSWLGTSFVRADLTEADFSHAQLNSTGFNNACLIRTNFQQAKKLKFADLKNTILENRAVRELLVTGDGTNQSYAGLNLTGAYLRNANLQQADLSQANLLEADLRGANLTGAKIGHWLIDTTTLLDDIQCDYMFLENDKREPPEGIFKKGEFTKLFQQIAKPLAFLIETRLELEALLRAADKLRNQNIYIEFGSVENKQGSAKVTFITDSTLERDALFTEMKREFEHQKMLIAEDNSELFEKEVQIATLTGLLAVFSRYKTDAC